MSFVREMTGGHLLKGNVFPDDKIMVVLLAAGACERSVRFDESRFQELIHGYKNNTNDPFSEFSFRTSGTSPYSSLLERVLMRGRISRSIVFFGDQDGHETLLLNSPRQFLEDKLRKKFAPEEWRRLTEIGAEIGRKLEEGRLVQVTILKRAE